MTPSPTSPHRALPVVMRQPLGNDGRRAPVPPTSPLILVSVGTDHHPFNRLVQWVDAWAAARSDVDVVIQHGEAAPPAHARAVPYLSHSELCEFMNHASVVVSHGGPATIAEAWNAGLIPIVAPRGHRLGEHVDDHQQAFAALLAAREQVVLVATEAELLEALDHALADADWLRRESAVRVDVEQAVHKFAAVVAAVTGNGGRRAQARRRKAFRKLSQ